MIRHRNCRRIARLKRYPAAMGRGSPRALSETHKRACPHGVVSCDVPLMGGRSLCAETAFRKGNLVFEEEPLCETISCSVEAALEATNALSEAQRVVFDDMFGDASLPAFEGRAHEERLVLSVWELNAYA